MIPKDRYIEFMNFVRKTDKMSGSEKLKLIEVMEDFEKEEAYKKGFADALKVHTENI